MRMNYLSPLLKLNVLSSVALLSFSTFSADNTISELVDVVNGTFDEPARQAGKKAKLRNHAKGLCTSGTFVPASTANEVFNIPFFAQKEINVTGRFSLGGTNPNASDKSSGRFMSLKIDGDKESLNFVTTNAEVFFASNLNEFYSFQSKIKEGSTGRQWLIDNQPNAKAFLAYTSALPITASFAGNRYFGVNSFIFTMQNGQTVPGRWFFEPTTSAKILTSMELSQLSDDFLKTELLSSIKKQPATWDLYVQLAQPEDQINDPTVLWPNTRQRVLIGQLNIDGLRDSDQTVQTCSEGIFNPILLPKGIVPSDDPILHARTPAYVESLIRRF
ncbi:MAG: catalase family peroxidase [Shewanella sp.]